MAESQLNHREQNILDAAESVYQKYHKMVVQDPDYPALHLAPPVGRLNDPNGLVYKDGIYHAFYQYSPLHPTHTVYWRHATSSDLTQWKDDQTAIAPQNWYEKSGCYSGSGIVAPDGSLEFFYTGNVKDDRGARESYQCLFTSEDNGQSFTKSENNPLISGPPPGYTAHIRDPQVFWRENKWWAVLGAQRENLTGAVVYYTSDDRRNWRFQGEFSFSDSSLHELGYMFECPVLFSLKDQSNGKLYDVLLFCPQGMEAEGERFNNIFQCGYVVGHLRDGYFEVITSFTEIDAGFEFYAPQIISNAGDENAVLLMAWLGNPDEDDQPSWDHRWVHMLTYPRHLSLYEGKIFQVPHAHLEQVLQLKTAELSEAGEVIGLAAKRTFRVRGKTKVSEEPVVLAFKDEQGIALEFTMSRDVLTMNRAGSRYTVGGALRRRSIPAADNHTFEVFFDGSAIEVYVDDGATTVTGRLYLTGELESVKIQHPSGKIAGRAVSALQIAVLD